MKGAADADLVTATSATAATYMWREGHMCCKTNNFFIALIPDFGGVDNTRTCTRLCMGTWINKSLDKFSKRLISVSR